MRRVWIPFLFGSVVAAGACQLMVGEATLDVVRCSPDNVLDDRICASGQICANGICVPCAADEICGDGLDNDCDTSVDEPEDCVEQVDASVGGGGGLGGAGGSPGTGAAPGTGGVSVGGSGVGGGSGGVGTGGGSGIGGSGGSTPRKPLGAACSQDNECQTDQCVPVPDSVDSVCSRFCCGSAECPTGSVCAPYYGANLCLDPFSLGLPPPGIAAEGAPCANGCRSSRCGPGNTCIDVCCVDGVSCLNGRACAKGDHAGIVGWYCASHTLGSFLGPNQTCNADSECDSNTCFPYPIIPHHCNPPCCSNANCGSGDACEYVTEGAYVVKQCVFTARIPPPSSDPPCCSDFDCASPKRCVPTRDDAIYMIGEIPYSEARTAFRCKEP